MIPALLLGAVAARGAEAEKGGSRKPAWKWTIEERLAARFDPAAMAAREAEYQAEQEAIRKRWADSVLFEDEAKMTGPPPATETIDGSKTPELFLPVELFGMLLNRAFPLEEESAGPQEPRSRIEQRAAALGFGRDLWGRLEKAAAPYLGPLHAEDRRRLTTRTNDTREDDRKRLCRLRAQALAAAKAEFGEENFLRLLYEAVAPTFRPTYILEGWPPDYQRHADLLLSLEGSCR
ncbi:MAG TPA: hypothetical protein VHC97_27285 [Thermoanaerobaculia bacterium]|nr:hypothetical protein [Thermoanaerobaculia bacterium]